MVEPFLLPLPRDEPSNYLDSEAYTRYQAQAARTEGQPFSPPTRSSPPLSSLLTSPPHEPATNGANLSPHPHDPASNDANLSLHPDDPASNDPTSHRLHAIPAQIGRPCRRLLPISRQMSPRCRRRTIPAQIKAIWRERGRSRLPAPAPRLSFRPPRLPMLHAWSGSTSRQPSYLKGVGHSPQYNRRCSLGVSFRW
jgi:hypothetical protein